MSNKKVCLSLVKISTLCTNFYLTVLSLVMNSVTNLRTKSNSGKFTLMDSLWTQI